MAEVGSGEQADLNKLKVNDLRKMLKTRGLSVVGNKQELIDRLQSSEAAAEALLEGSEVGDIIDEDLDRELDETALDDEPSKDVEEHKDEKKTSEPAKDAPKTDSSSGNIVKVSDAKDTKDKLNGSSAEEKPQAPKHKRITITDITVADANSRKKARLERFNQATTESANPAETTDALAKRTARFSQDSGPPATPKVINDPLNSKKTVEVSTKPETNELLKKRAQRFGILSPAEAKKQQLEKLQARKARFASTLTSTPATEKTTAPPLPAVKTASTVDEKKRLRAERFKIKV